MKTILLGILIGILISIIIIIIFKAVKNELNRERYMELMKPGDDVNVLLSSNSIDQAEIVEVREQTVVIKTVVPKDRVYPNKK